MVRTNVQITMNDKLTTWIIGFLGGCIGGTIVYLVIKFV